MPTMDAFNGDTFNSVSLSAAMMNSPFQPMLLGNLNLFKPRPVTTRDVFVDEKDGKLSLLSTAAPGDTSVNSISGSSRTARGFRVPHIPQQSTIQAADVAGIRGFNQETELEILSDIVNERIENMRNNHEVTHEFHRIGALKGTILDGDGSTTIYDLYTEFGKTQKEEDVTYASVAWSTHATTVIRLIEGGMGNKALPMVGAICGDTYWDTFIADTEVRDAYQRWQSGRVLFENQRPMGQQINSANMFPYNGILWQNYRGTVDTTTFLPTNDAYFFPMGATDDTFVEVIAPANFNETVNTRGQKFYAKQNVTKWNMGVELHSQSNVLYLCTNLDAVVHSTGS